MVCTEIRIERGRNCGTVWYVQRVELREVGTVGLWYVERVELREVGTVGLCGMYRELN